MKSNWVATLHAGKLKVVYNSVKNSGIIFLLSLLLLFISCDKSDDIETIINESPAPIATPPPNEPPISNEPPPNNPSPRDDDDFVIVYTDIQPDFTSENLNDSYNLDLNNDQVIDFVLSSASYDDWKMLFISSDSQEGNKIISVSPWYTHPLPLNQGQEIYKLNGYRNGEFYETAGILSVGDCFGGDQDCIYSWKNKKDKYLGLRFIINEQTHYGWAQLAVESVSKWVIKDYAYNSIPNKPIFAGQKE